MMNRSVSFFMEPIFFINDAIFLAGTNEKINQYNLSQSKEEALNLLFEQNLPNEYIVWGDFFAEQVKKLMASDIYNEAQEAIKSNTVDAKGDRLKDNIRKRKAFLLRKKMALLIMLFMMNL